MSIGVALIGSGIFAKNEHLPAIKASSNLNLKALYSRSLKTAQSLAESAGNVDLYADDAGAGKTYHDLLLRPDIQAVILALPILSQPVYIEAALTAGKHVLSEKPIAGDIKRAEKLIEYYQSDRVKGGATWGVAENFRYLDSLVYASQEGQKLGRVLNFRVKSFGLVSPGDEYFETPWRKKPEYQGGFLLDGGIHVVAAARLLLGDDAKPASVSAYTTLLREYLAPVDTVNSIWQTTSGVSGTFSSSFGTTISGSEYTFAYEKGSVTVQRNKVIVTHGLEKDGDSTTKEFPDEGSGVKQEVKAWAEAIVAGKPDPRQSPEQALADLEILEKLLTSGEGKGKPESLKYQI